MYLCCWKWNLVDLLVACSTEKGRIPPASKFVSLHSWESFPISALVQTSSVRLTYAGTGPRAPSFRFRGQRTRETDSWERRTLGGATAETTFLKALKKKEIKTPSRFSRLILFSWFSALCGAPFLIPVHGFIFQHINRAADRKPFWHQFNA